MCIEINNFYLGTPLTRHDYLCIAIILIIYEIIQQYNLLPPVRNGFIYLGILKGMCGFLQLGRLENNLFTECLDTKWYFQCTYTPGLQRQKCRPILFSLVVDDFGVNYVVKEHAYHLISSIKEFYQVAEDWTGSLYWGIKLNWYWKKKTVDRSMQGYVASALHKYQQKPAHRPQHSPHKWERPSYR